ncbi:hypothetical protein P170DRAFT_263194 [Aspergillus steynii IBT 23096]|uniref:Uncharacterized protein n=1 Tax=Aspergillus steynii IBT 23096 TaxID=1392250 RepID=A0A2I2G033_9EURO|nr:uncharacterized protein P170DRAFT_263194 [Aspergillus steynii IBT 23096]PLB46248.1 hypothetical protein P170DRAFT_263194 [Aspergillus steynii IBT 23096]
MPSIANRMRSKPRLTLIRSIYDRYIVLATKRPKRFEAQSFLRPNLDRQSTITIWDSRRERIALRLLHSQDDPLFLLVISTHYSSAFWLATSALIGVTLAGSRSEPNSVNER